MSEIASSSQDREPHHEPDRVCFSREHLTAALRDIEDLRELKATLYVGYRASITGRAAVDLEELLRPEAAGAIAGANNPRPATERVREAVERAVVNGHLLRVQARKTSSSTLLLSATTANRELLARLSAGDSTATADLSLEEAVDIAVYRPNAFALFERQVGPLTPLVAEQIRNAERAYPRQWIEEAIALAAANNQRSWRYIEAILVRWERSGGHDRSAIR